MKFSVAGKEEVSYTNRQGNDVTGIRLHLINEQLKRDNLEGNAVEQVFISARSSEAYAIAKKCNVNDYVEPLYNRYGSIEDLAILE